MFLSSKPTEADIEAFLSNAEADDYSYAAVGATLTKPPTGYNHDHHRLAIGSGPEDFGAAKNAIRQWKMFEMPWGKLFWPDTPIEIGRIVCVQFRHFGFYSLNASKIVYTIDEPDRFGFAYGTLTSHSETGEERFSVDYDETTGEVCYDIFAFSRPRHPLAMLGYPLARMLQKKFVAESKASMIRAVRSASANNRNNL